jgi:hypothetical protein
VFAELLVVCGVEGAAQHFALLYKVTAGEKEMVDSLGLVAGGAVAGVDNAKAREIGIEADVAGA